MKNFSATHRYGSCAEADVLADQLTDVGWFHRLEEILQIKSANQSVIPVATADLIRGAPDTDQPKLEAIYLGLAGQFKECTSDSRLPRLTQADVDADAENLESTMVELFGQIVEMGHEARLEAVGALVWSYLKELKEQQCRVAQFLISASPLCPFLPLHPRPNKAAVAAFNTRFQGEMNYLRLAAKRFADPLQLWMQVEGEILANNDLSDVERQILTGMVIAFYYRTHRDDEFSVICRNGDALHLNHYPLLSEIFDSQ